MPALPAEMTAIAIRAPGGPEMLVPEQRPLPQPAEGEVLVKVAAAGVNRPDVMQRLGPLSAADGRDRHSGPRNRRRGGRARRRRRRAGSSGDQVMALVVGRRLCRILPGAREPLPAGAGRPLAWSRPPPSPKPSSRSGTTCSSAAACKPARRCWCTAARPASARRRSSSPRRSARASSRPPARRRNATACRKLGADVAINYKTEDFVAATKAATGGKGADVILDMVGGDYIERNYEAAAVDGRIVQIAFQGEPEGHGRFPPPHAQAADPHRLDAARALGRGQRRDRARGRRPRAAADRRRQGASR